VELEHEKEREAEHQASFHMFLRRRRTDGLAELDPLCARLTPGRNEVATARVLAAVGASSFRTVH